MSFTLPFGLLIFCISLALGLSVAGDEPKRSRWFRRRRSNPEPNDATAKRHVASRHITNGHVANSTATSGNKPNGNEPAETIGYAAHEPEARASDYFGYERQNWDVVDSSSYVRHPSLDDDIRNYLESLYGDGT